MNYSRLLFSILLVLLTLHSALLSEIQKSILSSTFQDFVIHCKQMKKNPDLNAKALKSVDYTEIINLNDQKNCCSLEIPDILLTHFNSCITQNDQKLDVEYPQLIGLKNKKDINEKCLKTTFNLFCEHIFNNKSYNKSQNISDRIMNSCIKSFVKLFENQNGENANQNVMFLQKGEPLISYSSENILMRSFESEKLELKCVIQSFPEPSIQWLRNNQIIDEINNNSKYFNFGFDIFEIKNEFKNLCKTIAILEFPTDIKYSFGNYSCIAVNSNGKTSKTFSIEKNILSVLRSKMKIKRFNITGFVIGMCPPMLISFYLIIKLGYRSRYAQERTDENGMNEEPFFVSN